MSVQERRHSCGWRPILRFLQLPPCRRWNRRDNSPETMPVYCGSPWNWQFLSSNLKQYFFICPRLSPGSALLYDHMGKKLSFETEEQQFRMKKNISWQIPILNLTDELSIGKPSKTKWKSINLRDFPEQRLWVHLAMIRRRKLEIQRPSARFN